MAVRPAHEKIRILKLVRSGTEVAVTVSTLDTPVVLPEESVHKFRLKEGIVITAAQLAALQSQSELFRRDREVARLLALREHSIGELRVKLKRKSFASNMVRRVIQKYKKQGLLDDARFALAAAKNLLARRPCGRSFLSAYLQGKMIDRALAEQTVDAIMADVDESELARKALQSRWREFSHFELETARRKSYNYLVRRGFSYEAAKEAFEQLCNRQQEVIED
jgi:regulatory protein